VADDSILTGAHVALGVTVNGVPYNVAGKLLRFRETENKDEVVERPMGQHGALIAHEFVSHGVEAEMVTTDNTLFDLQDALRAAEIAGTITIVNVAVRLQTRAGTRAYLYRESKLAFGSGSARGESHKHTITILSGHPRERLA
jgi:hypothetical protein